MTANEIAAQPGDEGQGADYSADLRALAHVVCELARVQLRCTHPRVALVQLADGYPGMLTDCERVADLAGCPPPPAQIRLPPRGLPVPAAEVYDFRQPGSGGGMNATNYNPDVGGGAPRNDRARAEAAEANKAYMNERAARLQAGSLASRNTRGRVPGPPLTGDSAAFRQRNGIGGLTSSDLHQQTT